MLATIARGTPPVLSLVMGRGHVGQRIVESPDVDAVTFTVHRGQHEARDRRRLARACA